MQFLIDGLAPWPRTPSPHSPLVSGSRQPPRVPGKKKGHQTRWPKFWRKHPRLGNRGAAPNPNNTIAIGALIEVKTRRRQCRLLGVKRTSNGRPSMSAFDPKRTSLHCSTFAPIVRLIGAFIIQRLNLPFGRNQMPLGAFRCHARIAVAVSICLGVTATTKPSQKHDRATV
jgi:hypothetical protein